MPKLPTIVEPHLDEVLGSWLARLSLYNGPRVWDSFTSRVGYGRLRDELFNLFEYSKSVCDLFEALGTDYVEVLTRLTTYPYWLAFDRASRLNPQDPNSHPLASVGYINHLGRQVSKISRVYFGFTAPRQFCPRCVLEDEADVGECYLHRAHQLQDVKVCWRHGCLLQDRCRNCGYLTHAKARRRPEALIALCVACGSALGNQAQMPDPRLADLYLSFSRIGKQALDADSSRWDGFGVRALLLEVLDGRPWAPFLLATGDGASSGDGVSTSRWLPQAVQPQKKWRTVSAPECCALFAALGLNFDRETEEFVRRSGTNANAATEVAELTVEGARAEVLRTRGQKSERKRRAFLFLRTVDSDWVRTHFPATARFPLPSIFDDRTLIVAGLNVEGLTRQRYHKTVGRSAAVSRARIRDRQWYEATTRPHFERWKSNRAAETESEISRKRDQLLHGIGRLVALELDDQRPRHLARTDACADSGLSVSQIDRVMSAYPSVAEALGRVNMDVDKRLFFWAARRLLAENVPITPFAILKRAQRPQTVAAGELLAEVLGSIRVGEFWPESARPRWHHGLGNGE